MKTGKSLWWGMFVAVACTSCGEPSREEYRDEMARVWCEKEAECGDIGEDEQFSSMDDCIVEQRADFNDLWPASECDDGRINEERFEDCLNRADSRACDSLLDGLSFLSECNADQVCTDPAD